MINILKKHVAFPLLWTDCSMRHFTICWVKGGFFRYLFWNVLPLPSSSCCPVEGPESHMITPAGGSAEQISGSRQDGSSSLNSKECNNCGYLLANKCCCSKLCHREREKVREGWIKSFLVSGSDNLLFFLSFFVQKVFFDLVSCFLLHLHFLRQWLWLLMTLVKNSSAAAGGFREIIDSTSCQRCNQTSVVCLFVLFPFSNSGTPIQTRFPSRHMTQFAFRLFILKWSSNFCQTGFFFFFFLTKRKRKLHKGWISQGVRSSNSLRNQDLWSVCGLDLLCFLSRRQQDELHNFRNSEMFSAERTGETLCAVCVPVLHFVFIFLFVCLL